MMEALATTIFTATFVVLGASGLGFWFARKHEIIQKRHPFNMVALAIGLIAVQIQTFSNFVDIGDCKFTFVIWKSVLFNVILVQSVRLFGTVFGFKAHVRTLENRSAARSTSSVDLEEVLTPLPIVDKLTERYTKLASRSFLIKFYVALHSVQFVVLIASFAYASGKGNLDLACKNPITIAGGAYTLIVMIIAMIFAAITLRGIHDAFLIKTELGLWAIVALVPGFPAMAMMLIDSLKQYGFILIMVTYLLMAIISFALPPVVALYRLKRGLFYSTSEVSVEEGGKETLTIDHVVAIPKLAKTFEYYLVHYGLNDATTVLVFYSHLKKFENNTTNGTAGRAYIICQKFLKPDSYLPVPYYVIGEDKQEALVKAIEEASNQETIPEVGQGYFQEARDLVLSYLNDTVIHDFVRDGIYKDYRKTNPDSTAVNY